MKTFDLYSSDTPEDSSLSITPTGNGIDVRLNTEYWQGLEQLYFKLKDVVYEDLVKFIVHYPSQTNAGEIIGRVVSYGIGAPNGSMDLQINDIRLLKFYKSEAINL